MNLTESASHKRKQEKFLFVFVCSQRGPFNTTYILADHGFPPVLSSAGGPDNPNDKISHVEEVSSKIQQGVCVPFDTLHASDAAYSFNNCTRLGHTF